MEGCRVVVVDGVAKFVDTHIVNQLIGQGGQVEREGDVTLPCATTPTAVGLAHRYLIIFKARATSRLLQHSGQLILCHPTQSLHLFVREWGIGGEFGPLSCECSLYPLPTFFGPAECLAFGLPPGYGKPHTTLSGDA